MNIIATILAAITTHFAGSVVKIVSDLPALFVSGVLTLLDDEKTILGQALEKLLADRKAGKAWDVALTDCYNVFYNGEVTEGGKIAMAFLEWLSKAVEGL